MAFPRIARDVSIGFLIGVNVMLVLAATTLGLSAWMMGIGAITGAAIGVNHNRDRQNRLFHALTGSAGGLFVCIGLSMSVVGRIMGKT